MSAILREDPQLPAGRPSVSPAVERIVRRCLEKAPQERFQSARDIAFALEETQTGAAPPTAAALPARRSRSILWFTSLGLFLVALLVVLVATNAGGLRGRLRGRATGPRIESLAVLPLENLSRDPEQEYFADGMTEALIANLGKIGALRVISRTSVMQYKAVRRPLPEIARELNVDVVVEGSVLRVGDRVRITAQLIHAATDRRLWSEIYERDLRDVLALQSEVAQAIAHGIQIKVAPTEQARLASARPVNRKAYEAYLQGRYYWNKRTEQEVKKGIEHFQKAIDEDPAYAPAYAGLADCYNLLGTVMVGAQPPAETRRQAAAAATKALQIDSSLAEAHASLAYVRHYDWDWTAAEQGFKRAIDLNPSYATAHLWFAQYLAATGRLEEALAEVNRARELDPLSLNINTNVGWMLHFARRYDQAIQQYRRALEIDPNFAQAHGRLGGTYLQESMFDQAIAELESAVTLSGSSPAAVGFLAHAYAMSGRRAEAEKLLNELTQLSKQRYVSPTAIAVVHIGLGDWDQAFEWLEKAYRERSNSMVYLRVDPLFDPLRSDPRFVDLVRRVGFPP